MDEKKFNKIFSAFILIGMAVCVIISCIFKMQEPGARTALLVVSTFGALMGVVSVVLSANGSIWTFVFGLVDVLIYSYILYDSKMPSQLLLYVFYFIPMEFIGFFQWRRRGADAKKKVQAQRMNGRTWLKYAGIFVAVFAAALAISWFATSRTGEPLLWRKMTLDALITTANITALIMMAMAYMEQWYLWILVNIAAIIQWAITLATVPDAGYAIVPLIKYSFYLLNALNAVRIWLRLSEKEEGLQE